MARVDRQEVQAWIVNTLAANGGAMLYHDLVSQGQAAGHLTVAQEVRPMKDAGLIVRHVKVVEGGAPTFTIRLAEER